MSNTKTNQNFFTKSQGNKFAFTLAEVLIALAVIGIVAAVTIPTLVQSYKKRVVETRLAKFYSAINQAIQLSEIENGDKKNWDAIKGCNRDEEGNKLYEISYPLLWYEKYLKSYLQVLKAEKMEGDECDAFIYFSDGSLLTFNIGSWYFFPYAKDYIIKRKNPVAAKRNVGKTHFTFFFDPNSSNKFLHNKGVEPYVPSNWDGTVETLKNNFSIGCRTDATNEAAYCTKLIQLNGWKIPDDYPFKF